MASSGTINSAFLGYKIQIAWSVTAQSVENNTSTVTANVQLVSTGSSWTINSSTTKNGSLSINGTSYPFTFNATLAGNQTKNIFTKSVTISHNADGTKTCSFSCSAGINVTLSGTYYGNVTTSGNGTFNTIARATTPTLSASSVNMGASITINMPRASSTFDHTLTYKFGSATGTIGSDLGTSKAWTVPLSLASQIPNGTSGTCTITCKTYNGSTLIGTKAVSFTAKVPSSVVPSISALTVSEAVSGLAAQFGAYVQNKSKLIATVTAAGSYSSTISSYKTTIAGKNYSGRSVTSGVITTAGTVTISTIVTDSRGRTATKSTTVTVQAYTAPRITKFSAVRTNAGVQVAMNFAITSLAERNTKNYVLSYKPKTGSTWIQLASGSVYSYNSTQTFAEGFSSESSYDLRLVVTDYFISATANAEIPTAFTLLDFNASGKGIAFGKVSEKAEGIEFAMKTFFSNAETPSSVKYLQEGQNLNDVMEPGFYAIPNTTVARSLINKPWEGQQTGSLIVMSEGNTNQRVQILHKSSRDDGCIYERCIYQGTWGDWQIVHNGQQKVLWSGGYYMTASHIVNLSEKVSEQKSGIVLVFSRYSGGQAQNYHFNHFFISKEWVRLHGGTGCSFVLTTDGAFGIMASKYLYIHDDKIGGNDVNNQSGTAASGITYNNAGFVLRYVIGV